VITVSLAPNYSAMSFIGKVDRMSIRKVPFIIYYLAIIFGPNISSPEETLIYEVRNPANISMVNTMKVILSNT